MKRILLYRPVVALALWCAASVGYAHEFWIAPEAYQVAPAAPVTAQFKNGENFSGINLAFFDHRSRRFEMRHAGHTRPITARMGDVPAIALTAPDDGLLVLAHETKASTITYKEWEKFQAFADHKGFAGIRARHLARDLPLEGFRERYSRHAKSLIGVGLGAGRDTIMGLETEFVAVSNPYTDDVTQGFQVQLYYQGAPRADAQVEVFARSPDGAVSVSVHRTDDQGRATIPVMSGHAYLLDAVVLRESPAGRRDVWETLWAALTFAVP